MSAAFSLPVGCDSQLTRSMDRTLSTVRELAVVLGTLTELDATLREVRLLEMKLQQGPLAREHAEHLTHVTRCRRLLGILNRARLDIEATK